MFDLFYNMTRHKMWREELIEEVVALSRQLIFNTVGFNGDDDERNTEFTELFHPLNLNNVGYCHSGDITQLVLRGNENFSDDGALTHCCRVK